jgi:uncharacterized protein (DUF362 family)
MDQIGGIGGLVKGKTVAVKLNLTGNPAGRFQGLTPGLTHWTNPDLVAACCYAFSRAGAKRIRLLESGSTPAASLEDYMMNGGWDLRKLRAAGAGIEFERTNNLGLGKRYSRLKVPDGGRLFPAFDLNHSYEDADVFVSLAKLKNHLTCGVTLALKNSFGITPISIYGGDAGADEPNERARRARNAVLHEASRSPSKSAPQEVQPGASLDAGYRVPRIIVDLVAARPIDLAIIDGVQTITGAEGPWGGRGRLVQPRVLIAGRNPVCTDAVAMAVMGYNPLADRGQRPFETCDSTLALAEAAGIGTRDLSRIDVRGAAIRDVLFDFDSRMKA